MLKYSPFFRHPGNGWDHLLVATPRNLLFDYISNIFQSLKKVISQTVMIPIPDEDVDEKEHFEPSLISETFYPVSLLWGIIKTVVVIFVDNIL
jgi:hypothetical protein